MAVGAGEETGNCGVRGVAGVELFEDGQGFGGLGGVIVGEVDGGQLGLKRGGGGVVGVGGYGGLEEGFGLGGLVLAEQKMGEGGGGFEGGGVA